MRQRQALSQEELAKMAHVSPSTVLKIEAGKQHPRPSTLRRIARALKVDPSELVQEDTPGDK